MKKKVKFLAVDPASGKRLELLGVKDEFCINEYGDEYHVPCFIHKRGPLYYVFEHDTGIAISMSGRRTVIDARAHAAETCLQHGGISETEKAIDKAIELRGILNK